jgi:triacylglycerol lipase
VKLNKIEALKMLELDSLSVHNKEELKAILPEALFIEDKSTDTQCYVTPYQKYTGYVDIAIVFRGTEQKITDWLTDFNAFHMVVPYNNEASDIRVHGGLLNAYKSVRDKIHKYIQSIKERVGIIYVIGHSLGGGLATLCAVDMQYNYKSISGPVVCYTYGALKVGNKAFVDSYNTRVPETYRIYMRTDLVPLMPPKFADLLTGPFAHVNNGFSIGPFNPFIGLIEYFRAKSSKRIMEDLTNHSPRLYKKYLG